MPGVAEVRTDEDGNFRMAGGQAGRILPFSKAGTVARRILGAQSASGTETYPALIYFPSAGDLAGATPIDLVAGQKAHAEFSFNRGPAYKLAGTVFGVSAYRQVSPPMIVDESQFPLFTANPWNSQSGTFEFSALPAGTYSLVVHAVDNEGHASRIEQPITIDKNVTGLNVALNQSTTIPVVVRTELGSQPGPSCLFWKLSGAAGRSRGLLSNSCASDVDVYWRWPLPGGRTANQ